MAILRTLVDGLTAYADDCNFNFNALNSESATTASTVSGLSSTVSGLSSTVSGHTTSISSLNSTVSGHTTSISNLTTQITQAMPVGAIIFYHGSSAPTGFLICNGGAIPAECTALKALIGDNTPNLIGRYPKGGTSIGTTTTTTTNNTSSVNLSHNHAYGGITNPTESALGSHSHTYTAGENSIQELPCIKY